MTTKEALSAILTELKCNINNGILGLGLFIDKLSDENDKASLILVRDFLQRNIQIVENTIYVSTYLYYYANVLSDLGKDEMAVLNYRKAIIHKCFANLHAETKASIFVNLGSLMNKHGRYSEALEYYNKSLEIKPDFLMALGKIGFSLERLSYNLYDTGHKIVALRFAYKYLKETIEKNIIQNSLHKTQYDAFVAGIKEIEEIFRRNKIKKEISKFKEYTPNSIREKRYRDWCLENTLFLNPLNDIIKHSISAQDVIHLPNITFEVHDRSIHEYVSMFNQIKQEYTSSRFIYYGSINNINPHYSDKNVMLINPLSYAEYSLNVEKCKIAYRIMYSILDKIGYFLNKYFNLGFRDDETNFIDCVNNLFREQSKKKYNWSIEALHWIGKEIINNNEISPHSIRLNKIRNSLEHKFFQVTTYGDNECSEANNILSMGRIEFQENTLRLIKYVRSSIIALSLAIHINENIKRIGLEKKLIMPMPNAGIIEDKWKI